MSEDIISAHHLELFLGVLTSVPDPLEIFQELDSQVEERFGSMLGGNRERGLQFSVPEPRVGSDQVGQRVRTVVSIDHCQPKISQNGNLHLLQCFSKWIWVFCYL